MTRLDPEYILGPLDKLDLSHPLLYVHSNITNRFDELDEIDPAIKNFTLSNQEIKGEVLIPFMHSQGLTDYLFGFIGHALRTRGYRPLFLSCRGSLPLCLRKVDHPDTEGTCVNCRYKSDSILDAYGFDQIELDMEEKSPDTNEIPDSVEDLISMTCYRGIDIANYAKATTRVHLHKYHINLENPNEREIFERYLLSSIGLIDFTNRLINKRDIIAVIGNHPAYIYGGVVLETAMKRKIPAISYGGGYLREDSIIFGNMKNRKGFELFSDEDTLKKRIKTPLSDEERDKVNFYMEGRRDGSTIQESNHYIRTANEGLDLDKSKTTVGLFTNLVWDGSLSDSAVTFDSPFEWVEETINFVNGVDDIQLILKPHPAEAHRVTKVQMAEWVKSHIDIPDNLIMLEADTKINPYELIQEIDVAIVFNSTIGMEAVYEGVPVITTGDTHYKKLGFTYDPETPNDYFDLLRRSDELTLSQEEKQRAERYAHFLLVERHISVEGLDSIKNIHKIDHETIAKSGILDSVIKQIINDERSPKISCYS